MTGRAVNATPTAYTVNDLNEVTANDSTPLGYDNNGNRTSYGGSGGTAYAYDDENRLILMTSGTAYRTDFAYDGVGRLRLRTEYTWYYNQWNVASVTRYLYDGKRVIQERTGSNVPTVTYTRGKDLSGSLEDAGGIGGLLARSHGYSGGAWDTHNFYHADALGNVTYMLDSSQAMVASYKYDPYGRTVSSSGSLAAANLYRFSSKEIHLNSGFYYYLYRFYDSNTQRWPSRDPASEPGFRTLSKRAGSSGGGPNQYRFVANRPSLSIDPSGLAIWLCTRRTTGFPLGGYGRHAYLWDDRSPVQNHSCSQQSSYGSGHQTDEPSEEGPIGNVSSPFTDPFSEVECEQVPGSEGHENEIMDHCRKHANEGPWWPGIFDCHTAALRILHETGYPPASVPPRLNPGDPTWPYDLSWDLFWQLISPTGPMF